MSSTLAAGMIDSVALAAVAVDVGGLLNDAQVGTTVVIRTPGAVTADPATGDVSRDDTQDSVTAYLAPLSLRDVGPDSPYQVGDVRCSALASDLTTAPTTSSAFRAGSVRYSVVTVEKDPLGLFYVLVGRRTQ